MLVGPFKQTGVGVGHPAAVSHLNSKELYSFTWVGGGWGEVTFLDRLPKRESSPVWSGSDKHIILHQVSAPSSRLSNLKRRFFAGNGASTSGQITFASVYFCSELIAWTSKNIDCLLVHTTCLVCFISTVIGCSNKKEKKKLVLGRPALVAGI